MFLHRLIPVLLTALIACVSSASAHNALLFVEDNGNGSIYIEAGISTGESPAGSKIIIRDKATGQPLSTFVVPDSAKIYTPMPAVPYTVTLDMGVGHIVTKSGPFKDVNISAAPAPVENPAVSSRAKRKKLFYALMGGGILLILSSMLGSRLKKKK